ncbi:MAG: TetR/AcrR family transcriptional regulator [Candidatus Korobacteraceae bacterium]
MPETFPATPIVRSMPAVSSHDRILQSAKRLFARNGYENTSTVAIAREAGTSESQLMKHFGSKQGLLSAIFDRGWASIAERVESTQGTTSPADRLFEVLQAMVIELEHDADLKELIALEARRVRKDNRDVLVGQGFQQFADVVDRLLGEMQRQGQIRPDLKLDAVRAAFIGLTEGLVRDQVVARRSELHADYGFDDIRKVMEILVPALAGEDVRPLKAVSQ